MGNRRSSSWQERAQIWEMGMVFEDKAFDIKESKAEWAKLNFNMLKFNFLECQKDNSGVHWGDNWRYLGRCKVWRWREGLSTRSPSWDGSWRKQLREKVARSTRQNKGKIPDPGHKVRLRSWNKEQGCYQDQNPRPGPEPLPQGFDPDSQRDGIEVIENIF